MRSDRAGMLLTVCTPGPRLKAGEWEGGRKIAFYASRASAAQNRDPGLHDGCCGEIRGGRLLTVCGSGPRLKAGEWEGGRKIAFYASRASAAQNRDPGLHDGCCGEIRGDRLLTVCGPGPRLGGRGAVGRLSRLRPGAREWRSHLPAIPVAPADCRRQRSRWSAYCFHLPYRTQDHRPRAR